MEASSSWAGAFKVWVGLSRRPLLVRTSGARFNVVASDVYFWAASRKRRYQLPEKGVISPDQVLSALKRYLEESGDTEQAVASKPQSPSLALRQPEPEKGRRKAGPDRALSQARGIPVKKPLGEHSSDAPRWPLEL